MNGFVSPGCAELNDVGAEDEEESAANVIISQHATPERKSYTGGLTKLLRKSQQEKISVGKRDVGNNRRRELRAT